MAELDSELAKFHSEIGPNIGTMKGSATTLKSDLTTSKGKYQQALSTITSAWKSSDSSGTKSLLQLLVDANERLETSVGSDLISGLDDCQTLDNLIGEILGFISKRNSLKPAETVTIDGKDEYHENNQKEIDELNKKIEFYNDQGKKLLAAIESGFSGVSLGIVGNIRGGSLGNYSAYENSYKIEDYPEVVPGGANGEGNEQGKLNILQQLGCGVVGAAEGVLKVGENIVDGALTLVGNVVTLGGLWKGGANFFKKVIEYDVVGSGASVLGSAIAGSKEAYQNSLGRKIGFFAGKTAGSIVAYAYGGPLLLGLSAVGDTSERALQNGDSLLGAGVKGVAMGALTVATCNIASSIGTWAQTAAKGTGAAATVAKGINLFNSAVNKIPGIKQAYNLGSKMRTSSGLVGKIGTTLWHGNTTLVRGVKTAAWKGEVARASHGSGKTTTTNKYKTTTTTVTRKNGASVEVKTTAGGKQTITTTNPDNTKIVEELTTTGPKSSGNVTVKTYDASGNLTSSRNRGSFIRPATASNTGGNLGYFNERLNQGTVVLGTLQQEMNNS